jgi:hypothetical protein
MRQQVLVLWLIAAVLLPAHTEARAETVHVKNSSEFSSAAARLKPGTTLLLEPGDYAGGLYLADISIDRTSLTDGKFELNDDRLKAIGAHAYRRVR